MKKIYKKAEAGTAPGGHVVRLDGKLLKTPLGNNLILASSGLASLITDEWQRQGNEIISSSMPLTQLVNVMIDKADGPERQAMNAEILKYGASDLVCYLATHPADLVRRQEEHWLPLVQWMKEKYDVTLETVRGIQYHNQPFLSLQKLEKVVNGLSPEQFTFVQAATAITGSLTIACAMLEGRLDAKSAYLAACVDEIYQLEKWGEDGPARKRLERIEAELAALEQFKKYAIASS